MGTYFLYGTDRQTGKKQRFEIKAKNMQEAKQKAIELYGLAYSF